jgi:proteasome activator subunit 4
VLSSYAVPTEDEIEFVLEILDKVFKPTLDKVEELLESTGRWDGVARNDFCRCSSSGFFPFNFMFKACRFLHTCRAIWSGLSTFYQEAPKEVANPCITDTEIGEMIVSFLDVKAGFTLTDPSDSRYQRAVAHKTRFGEVCGRAASALRQGTEGEDHIDAVLGVTRAIDTFMLGYALNRSDFDSLQKNYTQARE